MRCWQTKIVEQRPKKFKHAIPIASPASGKILDLASTNSPTAALRMFGEGIALQLSGQQINSPVNGKIIELSPTGQSVRIKAKTGVNLLISFVDDISSFMGSPFHKDVQVGQSVAQGDSLLRFDLNQLKTRHPHVYLSVTIGNADRLHSIVPSQYGRKVMASIDDVMTLYV